MRTDASSVGSLDTLHATDGLVHTIPGTYRYLCTTRYYCWYMYTIPCIHSRMPLVMHTTTTSGVCCDTSSVGSLDTLHTTDGLVDTYQVTTSYTSS